MCPAYPYHNCALTNRAIERKDAAESELEKVRTQLETALKTEMFNHEKELEKLRDDFSRQLSAANDKIALQGRENTELHGKVATLQTALTTQKITMEQETDRAVSVARELEKDRNEQTIADLRQRLEVLYYRTLGHAHELLYMMLPLILTQRTYRRLNRLVYL